MSKTSDMHVQKQEEGRPALTQRMTLHLTGKKYSSCHYAIDADGKPTGVSRHTKTNGRPGYKIVADEMHFGEETFDILGAKGRGMVDWVLARLEDNATKG